MVLKIPCLYSVTFHKRIKPLGGQPQSEDRGFFGSASPFLPLAFDKLEQPNFSRDLKMNHSFQNFPSNSVDYQTSRPSDFDCHICVGRCLCAYRLESMAEGRLDLSHY